MKPLLQCKGKWGRQNTTGILQARSAWRGSKKGRSFRRYSLTSTEQCCGREEHDSRARDEDGDRTEVASQPTCTLTGSGKQSDAWDNCVQQENPFLRGWRQDGWGSRTSV